MASTIITHLAPIKASLSTLYSAIPFCYMALFPVLNPLGSAFIILTLTNGTPENVYKQLCRNIAINTFILLAVVLIIGTYILQFFGISVPIVQVGGGIVVAMIGWNLLNQNSDPTDDKNATNDNVSPTRILSKAFYPLTMPITAGPGCMAVALTVSAHETVSHNIEATLFGQAGALIGILLSVITIYFCYRYAEVIVRRLGASGASVIMRISAFINFCIGLEIIWHGISALLNNLFGST